MNNQEKQVIVRELERLVQFSSQNKVATRLRISTATISQMINNNWDLINDSMWRRTKVNMKLDLNWRIVPTENYKKFMSVLQTTQQRGFSIAISETAGLGKSEAFKQYTKSYKNVIHIECSKRWKKKTFVKHLCITAGLDSNGTEEQMIERFLDHTKGLQSPLIILDQVNMLKNSAFDLFVDMYNDMFGHCAFVLSGVKALKKIILSGFQNQKDGYEELWSRIGRKFYEGLHITSKKDVMLICKGNGVTDEETISFIFNTCEGDLRSVRRQVEKAQLLSA